MTTPDPGISAWQVYQQLAEVSAKLSVLIAQGNDHEARLRLLEKSRWPLGNISAIVGVAGVVVAIIAVIYGH